MLCAQCQFFPSGIETHNIGVNKKWTKRTITFDYSITWQPFHNTQKQKMKKAKHLCWIILTRLFYYYWCVSLRQYQNLIFFSVLWLS